jgi:hypothetical protein
MLSAKLVLFDGSKREICPRSLILVVNLFEALSVRLHVFLMHHIYVAIFKIKILCERHIDGRPLIFVTTASRLIASS